MATNFIAYKKHHTLIILLFSFVVFSCKKLVNVDAPVTNVNQVNVFASDGQAISSLIGIYTQIQKIPYPITGLQSLSILGGLSADELTLYGGVNGNTYNLALYYKNNLSPLTAGAEYWSPMYNYIYECNAIIEGLNSSTSLTPSVKDQLMGEAEFMRAFFYFYLVNLYGDIPLPTSTDWKINSNLPRAQKSEIYNQIIADLTDAQKLLSNGYVGLNAVSITSERIRPNKWAATALLARVYLYIKDWPNAEAQASSVIGNSALYNMVSINEVFIKNSSEAIWQLQPIVSGWNTQDARTFIIPSTGPTDATGGNSGTGYPVYLASNLLNSFEAGDSRRFGRNWIDSVIVGGIKYYFPYKYKRAIINAPVTEYLMVLRLSEQYLIRAEARIQQNNINGSQSDLNIVRNRANLGNTTANDKAALLSTILHERQVELFTEWGHRWLDLKRTDNLNQTMTFVCPQKGSTWNSFQQLYPIPPDDINRDLNLSQNDGY